MIVIVLGLLLQPRHRTDGTHPRDMGGTVAPVRHLVVPDLRAGRAKAWAAVRRSYWAFPHFAKRIDTFSLNPEGGGNT